MSFLRGAVAFTTCSIAAGRPMRSPRAVRCRRSSGISGFTGRARGSDRAPHCGSARQTPATGSLHLPARLCGLRRNDKPLSERMQRRFHLADMRTVVRVDETADRAFADSQSFGERGVADALRTHRAVEGPTWRQPGLEAEQASVRVPADGRGMGRRAWNVPAKSGDETVFGFRQCLLFGRALGQRLRNVRGTRRGPNRPPASPKLTGYANRRAILPSPDPVSDIPSGQPQLSKHGGQQPRADFLAAVLHRGEAVPQIQPPVASLAPARFEAHRDAALPTQPPYASDEFVADHDRRTDMYESRLSRVGRDAPCRAAFPRFGERRSIPNSRLDARCSCASRNHDGACARASSSAKS